jgi:hypothetical protein
VVAQRLLVLRQHPLLDFGMQPAFLGKELPLSTLGSCVE